MNIFRLTYGVMIAALLGAATTATAQNDKKITDQRKKISELERSIAEGEKKIRNIKNDKSSKEQNIRQWSKQIELRNDLLQANERQSQLLQREVDRADSTATALARQLDERRDNYRQMVRESYRNYRNDNYISFIFSAGSFTDMARRIAILREVAAKRGERIAEIEALAARVDDERAELGRRKASLDSVKTRINAEKRRMQNDVNSARNAVKKLSEQEKRELQQKLDKEKKLSIAKDELRRLTQGNKEGSSFSAKSKIDLPVEGGRRGKIAGEVCEIFGKPNARVNSVYDGKVIAIRQTGNRYEVYIAHGQSVSSYSNLSEVVVSRNQTVKRNQRIGTIGSWVNPLSSEPEYKILFQLQSTNSNKKFALAQMFTK